MHAVVETPRIDRRTARTRIALRDALATEILATGDLSQVTVTSVAERAGVTRRTFYSHYRDIPNLVSSIEAEALDDLAVIVKDISGVTLDHLEEALDSFDPCPGSEDMLVYLRDNGEVLGALLGEGGDPAFAEKIKAFAEKIKAMVHEVVHARASEGFALLGLSPVADSIFDYYLTFVISAEVGVVIRWMTTGMREPVEMMSRLMTALLFVRPGDLYGRPINFDIPTLAGRAVGNEEE